MKQDKSGRMVIGDLRDDNHRPPVAAPNGNERLALFGDKEFRTQQSMVKFGTRGQCLRNAAAAGDGDVLTLNRIMRGSDDLGHYRVQSGDCAKNVVRQRGSVCSAVQHRL